MAYYRKITVKVVESKSASSRLWIKNSKFFKVYLPVFLDYDGSRQMQQNVIVVNLALFLFAATNKSILELGSLLFINHFS